MSRPATSAAANKEQTQLPKARSGARTTRKIRGPDIHPLDRAIEELRKELARLPNDATLHGRTGALYYRRGDLAEAENYYRKAVQLNPNRPSFHNNLGNVLCDRGQLKEGIACYERAMALEKAAEPTRGPSPEAQTNLELARLEYRLIHERIEYFERAVQLQVDSSETLNALGCAHLLRNQRIPAHAAFRKAAAADQSNAFAAKNIGFIWTLGQGTADSGTEALTELAQLALRFPTEPRIFIHQGELLEAAGLLDEAEAQYLRAVKADPRCLEAYDLLGRLGEVTGGPGCGPMCEKEVEAILERMTKNATAARGKNGSAHSGGPSLDLAAALLAEARLHRSLPDAGRIDELLRETLRMEAASPEPDVERAALAAVWRAQLLESEGNRDEASMCLDQATERYSQSGRLWFERGSLAYRRGEIALTVEAFERAILAQPQDAVAYHSLRFAFEGYRRYRTERTRFESAMKANPRDPLAHHHLALSALSVLKDEEALFHFTRALELDPRLAEAACGKGKALQRQGHLAEAAKWYRKALEIEPEYVEARRALEALDRQSPDAAKPKLPPSLRGF